MGIGIVAQNGKGDKCGRRGSADANYRRNSPTNWYTPQWKKDLESARRKIESEDTQDTHRRD